MLVWLRRKRQGQPEPVEEERPVRQVGEGVMQTRCAIPSLSIVFGCRRRPCRVPIMGYVRDLRHSVGRGSRRRRRPAYSHCAGGQSEPYGPGGRSA